MTEQERLFEIHKIRTASHFASIDPNENWPQNEKDWRQVEHGSPCDTNIHMAKWHLKVARQMQKEGLL